MTIHEYGAQHERVLVLLHPSLVMYDYFDYVTPLLEPYFHLVIPALPGYDPECRRNWVTGCLRTDTVRSAVCMAARWAAASLSGC